MAGEFAFQPITLTPLVWGLDFENHCFGAICGSQIWVPMGITWETDAEAMPLKN